MGCGGTCSYIVLRIGKIVTDNFVCHAVGRVKELSWDKKPDVWCVDPD